MAVDIYHGNLYWTDNIYLRRTNLAGTAPVETLVTNTAGMSAIDVDGLNGKIYFGAYPGIWSSNLDGTNVQLVVEASPAVRNLVTGVSAGVETDLGYDSDGLLRFPDNPCP